MNDAEDALAQRVKSVTPGDASISISGTATDPVIAVAISAASNNVLELDTDGLKVILPDKSKVTASTTNGKISVDGTDILVYDLPRATATALGGIKSAENNTDGSLALNKVYVDESTSVAEVKAISTDILVNGAEELILCGGDAGVVAEAKLR